jgi:ATP-dependent Zn protease
MIPSYSTDEEATAYHEAGHAVMGAIRNRLPQFVTIVPHGGLVGKNEFPEDCRPEFKSHLGDSPEKRTYIETRILIGLAGTIAHDLRFPARVHDIGDVRDEGCARAIIEENAGWADNCRDSYFQQLQKTARGLLQTKRLWVEAVAHALIENRSLPGAKVIELRPRR